MKKLLKKMLRGKKPKVGLALSGGVTLGAAHVGVLKALEEEGIKVDYLAGTSIGAVVGAFYSFGMPVDEIEQIALNLDWPDISGIALSKMGLLSNKEMGKLLDRHLGDVTFDKAQIPLAVVATDISTGEKVILNDGDVSEAVKASTCIPIMFEPVEINGRLLVDGGLKESIPLSPIQQLGARFIIAVDLNAHRKYERPENILDILNNTLDIALTHLANVNPKDIDVLVQPHLEEFSRSSTDGSAEMIERGYEATIMSLQNIPDEIS